jgi:hypothetical protein
MKNKKEATGLIHNNQIVIVTGRAGSESLWYVHELH